MTLDEKARLDALLKQHAAILSEHFDSVQILCTAPDGISTRAFLQEAGDFYAR